MASGKYPRGIRYLEDRKLWLVRFTKNGQDYSHTFKGRDNTTNLDKARRLLARAKDNVAAGLPAFVDSAAPYASATNPSFRQVGEDWLRDLHLRQASDSHWADAKNTLNNVWLPHFKNTPIGNIPPMRVRDVIAAISWSSLDRKKNCMSVLRCVFDFAVERYPHTVEINPVPAFKRGRTTQAAKRKVVFMKRGEFERRIDAMMALDRLSDEQLAHLGMGKRGGFPRYAIADAIFFYSLAFETGMRTGELLAIRASDIDMNEGIVLVNKSIVRRTLKHGTKNGKDREVFLTREARRLIRERAIVRGPLFKSPSGDQLRDTDHYTKVWRLAEARADVAEKRPYCTRASRASELLGAGVPLRDVAQQLGHSESVCLDKYSAFIKTGDEKARVLAAEGAF